MNRRSSHLFRWVAGALIAASTMLAVASAQSEQPPPAVTNTAGARPDPVVPVHREPHHRQVFQYETTRILDAQIPPNDTTWFHTHEWPVLYITLSASQTRNQNLGEDWGGRGAPGATGGRRGAGPTAEAGRAAGPGGRGGTPRAASIPGYFDRHVTHRLQNIGTNLFHFMVVVNETPGDDATTVEAAGFTGEPELTNRWFRAYRVTVQAGASTPSHRHQAPVAIFQVTPGTGRAIGAMKFEFNEPGQWAFFDRGDSHEIRNTGSGPMEWIEVEVRRK